MGLTKLKILFLMAVLLGLMSDVCFSQNSTPAPLNFQTIDGTTNCYPYQVKVTNGQLTCSSNIATVTTGSGSVTSVTFTGDGIVDSSTPSTAVTTSGTLTATPKIQTANSVLAGPASGGSVNPTFRALVGADLPNPSSTTLGGVQSLASSTSKWINTISTSGVPSSTQPAASDLSNGVTGSGSVMLSVSPTTTGTLTTSAINASGGYTQSGSNINSFTGNVGISTSNPGESLDIAALVRIEGGNALYLNSNEKNYIVNTSTNDGDVRFFTNNSEMLRLSNPGNVGINSTVPGQKLDIQGTERNTNLIDTGLTASKVVVTDANKQLASASNVQDLAYCQTGGTNCPGSITGFANPTATVGTSAVNGVATTSMRSDGAPAINLTMSPTWTGNHTFAPSSGNTVFSAGNVGISTTIPGEKLAISTGNIGISGVDALGTSQGILKFYDPAYPAAYSGVEGRTNAVGGNQTDLVFYTGYATASEKMRITAQYGNVGIGTSTPQAAFVVTNGNVGIGTWTAGQMLDIQGTGRMTGFTLTGNGASSGFILQSNGSTGIGTWVPEPTGGGSTNPGGSPPQLQYASNSTTFGGIGSGGTDGTNIGIGTISFTNRLNIVGNVGISTLSNSSYVTNTIPSPIAMIVEGNVGIGTFAPIGTFEIGTGNTPNLFANGTNISIGTKTAGSQLTVGSTGQFTISSAGAVSTSSSITSTSVSGFTNATTNAQYKNNSSSAGATNTLQGGTGVDSADILLTTTGVGTTDYIKFVLGNNGGTEAMRIQDNSGTANVGIGTTNPGQTLDVSGNIRSVGTNKHIFGSDNTNYISNSSATAGDMTFNTNSTERMRIANGANVGINSATPGARLDVLGAIRASGTNPYYIGDDNTSQISASATTSPDMIFKAGSTEIMRITNGGNVGIGSTAPGSKFEINNAAGIRMVGSSANIYFKATGGGANTWRLISNNDTNGTFDIYDNGGNQRITVDGANLGIGTTVPGQILDVGGNIRTVEGLLISTQATTPTASACGTSPSVTAKSTDVSGSVVIGSGVSTTSCTIALKKTHSVAPNCICADDTNVLGVRCTENTTTLTITTTASMSSDTVTWICPDNQ